MFTLLYENYLMKKCKGDDICDSFQFFLAITLSFTMFFISFYIIALVLSFTFQNISLNSHYYVCLSTYM